MCIERQAARWYTLFTAELHAVRRIVRAPSTPGALPEAGSRLLLLRGLRRRVESMWHGHQAVASCLPVMPEAAQAAATYQSLHASLSQEINSVHGNWYAAVKPELPAALSNSILWLESSQLKGAQQDGGGALQGGTTGGLLVNLAPSLLIALDEASLLCPTLMMVLRGVCLCLRRCPWLRTVSAAAIVGVLARWDEAERAAYRG